MLTPDERNAVFQRMTTLESQLDEDTHEVAERYFPSAGLAEAVASLETKQVTVELAEAIAADLAAIRTKYLRKGGPVEDVLREIGKLAPEDRQLIGERVNAFVRVLKMGEPS